MEHESHADTVSQMDPDEDVPCANHVFCDGTTVSSIGFPFCMTCGSWFKMGGLGFDRLEFEDNTQQEECVVCCDVPECFMRFPTKCGHSFCVPCSQNILLRCEWRYHLSVEPYGGPSCPNRCINPVRGPQCDCEERRTTEDVWEHEHPIAFRSWSQAEEASVVRGETEGVYGKRTCPMCRSVYSRP